jgi:hypothetical protein
MRYRLGTLFLLVVTVALAMAWWRDHRQLAVRFDLQQRQIRQLQRQVAERGFSWISTGIPFKSTDELIDHIEHVARDEFDREDFSAWRNSFIANQTEPALVTLLDSASEETRRRDATPWPTR